MTRREISCKAKLLCFLITEGICCTLIYTGLWSVPCFFERWLHIPCLGCGMTQASICLLQGDVLSAVRFHPFVLPFAVFMIVMHSAIVLYLFNRKVMFEWMKRRLCDPKAAAVVAALWGVRVWLY